MEGIFLWRAQRWNPTCATQVSECIPDGEPVEGFHQYQGGPYRDWRHQPRWKGGCVRHNNLGEYDCQRRNR